MSTVLDHHLVSAPSHQNALDIFQGSWSSRFPVPHQDLKAGWVPLFEDPRITWAIEKLAGILDNDVLELGPLEGGHSFMLEQAGARSILSLESNTNAFLRCLVVKEIMDLKRVHFLCGDFRQFLASNKRQFDTVFACGVLYHMTDPVRLLLDVSRCCRRLFLWTHYYDASVLAQNEVMRDRFGPAQFLEFEGLQYELHSYSYETALTWDGFCGGTAPSCAWLTRSSILKALKHFGFNKLEIGFEQLDHPNGPCFAIAACKE